jgi:CHAT domain-containing protein
MTGFDANRDAVFDTDLSQYRYVHFATHGLIDSRYPMLSALALSRYGRDGKPRDALLRLANIYDLRLNADLLVLSACETALGREIRGEGLVGLAQGFLYAGARSLVVSLWRVPDRATSELMSRFYRYLFEEELSPADALRRAKLSVASERRWRDPYFWAAMMLVGDWQ